LERIIAWWDMMYLQAFLPKPLMVQQLYAALRASRRVVKALDISHIVLSLVPIPLELADAAAEGDEKR